MINNNISNARKKGIKVTKRVIKEFIRKRNRGVACISIEMILLTQI